MKISQLEKTDTITDEDSLIVSTKDGGTNLISFSEFKDAIGGGSGPAPSAKNVYGVTWSNFLTNTKGTRTDDAASFGDPSPALSGGSGSSPFDDIAPWSGLKKVTRGSKNVMVEIPKYWYQWSGSGTNITLKIANYAAEGFHISPAHMDRGDGHGVRDVIYIGRYHSTTDSSVADSDAEMPSPGIDDDMNYGPTNVPVIMYPNAKDPTADPVTMGYDEDPSYEMPKEAVESILGEPMVISTTGLRSLSGKNPTASQKHADARTGSKYDTFSMMDWATWVTYQMLYLVEFADWNSQKTIGYGVGSGSVIANGSTDGMAYHTGTMASSRDAKESRIQYRWVENPWGNVRDWVDGVRYADDGMYTALNPASYQDTSGGKLVGKPSSGYPSALAVSESGGFQTIYPSAASGGGTDKGTCDYWNFSGSSDPCLSVGGSYSDNAVYGLFYVYHYSASSANADFGSRLQELP